MKEFLVKFEELYVRYITTVLDDDEKLSEYSNEIDSSKWRRAADPFRDSLIARLKPLVN